MHGERTPTHQQVKGDLTWRDHRGIRLFCASVVYKNILACMMRTMTKPPPPPQTLIEQLLAMPIGGYLEFDGNPPTSVRASISRLKIVPKNRGRNYITRRKKDSPEITCVWRLK